MKVIFKILLFLLIGFTLKAQTPLPAGFPSPSSTSWYKIGWMQTDSGAILAIRDTTMRARFAGTEFMWQHNAADTNVWFFDGRKYFHYVKSAADIATALGYVPQQQITLTTLGTSGPATLISGTLNIPQYSGGGGGGNIVSINSLTASAQTMVTGTAGSDFGISSVGSVHTFNIPTADASHRGLLSTTDWANFNSKQPQLNGTGFVKATGTVISYDNTVYYPNSNPSAFISRTGISALAPILYNSGSGVISADTSTGLTHLATQAFVLANQAMGTITGAGNLPPLFTTSSPSGTILFTLSNAPAFTVYANNTGSPAPPAFVAVNLSTAMVTGTLPATGGGTGIASYTVGDLLVANSTTTLTKLADVALGQVLKSGGVGAPPLWGTLGLDDVLAVNQALTTSRSPSTSTFALTFTGTAGAGSYVLGATNNGAGAAMALINSSTSFATLNVSNNSAGPSVSALSNGGAALYGQTQSAATNTVLAALQLRHNVIAGNGANGIGESIEFYNATTTTSSLSNTIVSKWTNATEASKTSEFSITGFNNAIQSTLLTISGNGAMIFGKYGIGTFTGTTAYVLAVDASGNVIETAAGALGLNSYYFNGMHARNDSTAVWGGKLDSTTLIDFNGHTLAFTNMPNKSSLLATDSLIIGDNAGILYKLPKSAITLSAKFTTTSSSNTSMALVNDDYIISIWLDPTSNETVQVGTTSGGSDILAPQALTGGQKYFFPISFRTITGGATFYYTGITSSTVITLIRL